MRRISIALLVVSLCFPLVFAQAPALQMESPQWSVDDVLMAEQAGGLQISPDGRWAVWVKSGMDKDKNERISNLVLSSLTEKREVELTRGTDSCSNPKWSPDGQYIAFVTTRPDPKAKEKPSPEEGPKPQLWLIHPYGGEAWPLTSFARGITNYEWADADTILFAAPEDPSLYESQAKEKKDTSVVVEDEEHAPPVRLFRYAIKSKTFTRLTDNGDRIISFAVSPDGRRAVTVHDRSLRYVYDQKIKPVVFLYDLQTGERRQIFEDRKFNISGARWALDGRGFYATSEFTNHPTYVNGTITEMYYFDLAAGAPVKVNLDWERGLAYDWEVTGTGFVALLADGARHRAARYTREGGQWRREWLDGEHARNIFAIELGRDGRTLAYAYTTASTPAQWYRARLDGARISDAAQLTNLNPGFQKKTIARSEVIRWKGALDEEVEGILYYPHGYEAGKKYPLVVMIHGGPAGADFDEWDESWAYSPNLMAQRGAFVLRPNYHGSSNYGLKFVESICCGKYYDLEVPDIEKGVDHLIGRGMVDADRLGVMGWSNGSILTIALTTASNRYKVASAGAGNVEWTSDWGNAHFGASFDNYYLGKSPIEDPELYLKKAPFYKLDRVTTPTIIFFGTEDTNVPTSQGWLHYRALQQHAKTDVRFILFPGEKHSPRKLTHQKRKLEEELAWFDKYLFKTLKPEDESLKPDSPLAAALKVKSGMADGRRVGVLVNGKLVPETVRRGGVEVGRFEVTRAQFAEFDPSYRVEPGRENYPANNISFEQAQAYCEWLSRLTGQTYRLATEAEGAILYAAAQAPENNLDYWAGYAVNPEDAARLQKKVAEAGSGALLKEVGSFKGAGPGELIFDLGGNVAEWVTAEGGGRLMGASADTPVDPKIKARRAAPDYTGFRVLKEPK